MLFRMEPSLENLQLAHDALAAGDTLRASKHLTWTKERPTTTLGHTVLLFAALLTRAQSASR